MSDPPPYPRSRGDADEDAGLSGPRSRPGLPRWVKVSAIVLAVLVVIVVSLAVTGLLPGEHGPGQFGPGQHGP